MKKFILAACVVLGLTQVSDTQGINPVTPSTNSMIQIQAPAFIDPSNLYTTPSLLGPTLSVPAANLTGATLAAGVTGSSLTSVGTLISVAVTGAASAQLHIATGALPTLTGTCAVVAGTRAGGSTAGSFAVPAGNCIAGTTVIAALPTATNGWACDAHDLTTPTSIFDQTATAAATITFTIRTVTANAADAVVWKCMGY